MKYQQKLQKLLESNFQDTLSNAIWKTHNKTYEVFGNYRIESAADGHRVFCNNILMGVFSTTRTALSWCIADKHRNYNTARRLLTLDTQIAILAQDIKARLTIGQRCQSSDAREIIMTKLESKILHKKLLENQLNKCVSWAKYCQQRGFNNETARTGRSQPNQTSRSGF